MSAAGDELIRKLRCALAEEGYGDVYMVEEGENYGTPSIHVANVLPVDVRWRACRVVGMPVACWACFTSQDLGRMDQCVEGNCTAGPTDPKVPPRRVAA